MIEVKIINDYSQKLEYLEKDICSIINFILENEEKTADSISIILTNRLYLSKLKKKYFNVDQYTDVIAFNLEDEGELDIDGEIYISIDDVMDNAKIYSSEFNNEFCRVLIHGILHLAGYDDDIPDNIKIMRKLEEKYLLNFTKEIIKKC